MTDVWSLQLLEASQLVVYGAECRDCKIIVNVDLDALVTRLGPNFPIKQLRSRLKCAQCGGKRIITSILFRDNTATQRLTETWVKR